MPASRASRQRNSSKGAPEWLAAAKPRRSSSRRVSVGALEQFDTQSSLQSGTPRLSDAPASPGTRTVSFRDEHHPFASSSVASGAAEGGSSHPAHVSHALRGRAEGLRIQAELLEKEALQHETRHKLTQGESCGPSAADDLASVWANSVQAVEKLCGAAVALCLSAGSCSSAPPPRPRRSSTARLSSSALRPPGLAPVRSYERQLPLADPGPAIASYGQAPSRQPSASILRRSSSGAFGGGDAAPLPPRQLARSGSAPERRKSLPQSAAEEAPKATAAPGLWRRALKNLSNSRKSASEQRDAAPARDISTGSGSPRSQTRFNFS